MDMIALRQFTQLGRETFPGMRFRAPTARYAWVMVLAGNAELVRVAGSIPAPPASLKRIMAASIKAKGRKRDA